MPSRHVRWVHDQPRFVVSRRSGEAGGQSGLPRRSGGPSEDVCRNTGTWLGCHSGLSECVRLKLHAFGASRHSCEAGGQSGFPRRSGGPSEDVGRNTGAWLGCHTGLSHWAVTLSFITAAGANDYRVCARPNCPCTRPWIDTITNKEHDFCCDSCRLGTPCTYDIYDIPTEPVDKHDDEKRVNVASGSTVGVPESKLNKLCDPDTDRRDRSCLQHRLHQERLRLRPARRSSRWFHPSPRPRHHCFHAARRLGRWFHPAPCLRCGPD